MDSCYVDFEPVGRRGQCPAGQTLLACAQQLGVDLVALCGGHGMCGRCRVQALSGDLSGPTDSERAVLSAQELEAGYRLACEARVLGDCKLRVPADSLSTPQRTQIESSEVDVEPEPAVLTFDLDLAPPSLSDLRGDAERVLDALREQHGVDCRRVDVEVLRAISPLLRGQNWRVQAAVRGDEVVALGPPSRRPLGFAVDVGTTKLAAYLVDLQSGQTLAAQGAMNPQIAYGEDLIARIDRTRGAPGEAARLQQLLVDALNELARDLCRVAGTAPQEILDAVVVGNTAMHHLFLCLPAEQLALAPYVPAVSHALDVRARDLGLRLAPGAYVHLLPNVAGYVGADHVAMLLATGMGSADGLVLALDIGTNTEVCLSDHGMLCSVSCASGPAFEGAHIRQGMRAARGAIEHVRLAGEAVECQTIEGAAAVGLCGSGILDALAQLYLAGVVNRRGKMGDHPRVRVRDGVREFVLVDGVDREDGPEGNGRPAVSITQRDVRELQLAKAAIRSGIRVLLDACGRMEQEIDEVIIAGAFGSYIDVASAIAIGMLPRLPLERFRQVGNAAGLGARLALISRSERAEAEAIARRVGYVELATAPDFMQIFAESNYLG